MSKKRISIRLSDDEVAVVAPLSRWQHLIFVYESLAASYPEDADAWNEAAAWVREWISKAHIDEEDGWS